VESTNINMTALLLPALHTPPTFGPKAEEEWETNSLRGLVDYAGVLLGASSSSEEEVGLQLKEKEKRDSRKVAGRKNARYGESGMYI
jgi:hypothetical protein